MGEEWNNNGYRTDGSEEYAFQTLDRRGRPKKLGWSVASLVCGIGVGFFAPELGVVVSVSITGLGIMSILESKK